MNTEVSQIRLRELALYCLHRDLQLAYDLLLLTYNWLKNRYPERTGHARSLAEALYIFPQLMDEIKQEARKEVGSG